jgi:4-hydroxy-tetrahydrodipicolinate synthase
VEADQLFLRIEMMETYRIRGVLAPVVTPFDERFNPDGDRLVAHCKWLISQNCGLAVFGTNSEGNSLSVEEKIGLLDALFAAGIEGTSLMPGTGCCALTDTVRLTKHAVGSGCAGVLMLPPFYYKGVSVEGLYRSYFEVIERVGDPRLRIYLYHIPQVSGVGIPNALIERLLKHHPLMIAGIKDSGGDWEHTKMLLDNFAGMDFDVFVGSESFLLSNMMNGGAGCISATANVNPAAIDKLYRQWNEPDAVRQQAALNEVREILAKHGMIPSLKAVIAHFTHHPDWAVVRPPLDRLTDAQSADIVDRLTALGFTMPGYET